MPQDDDPTVDLSTQRVDAAESHDDVIAVVGQFEPGAILAERFRVNRFVDRGGMGEVYEVEDLMLRGILALKTIRPEIARNAVAVERFKREVNIARRIAHANVSKIHDVGIHHGTTDTMFLTMEFLSGETLYQRIAHQGRIEESQALPIAEQIASALSALHEAGIIHRDLKSSNVMLMPTGSGGRIRVVVMDFGLARAAGVDERMSTLTESGAILGTLAYMAPEQVEGLPLTAAADIYAFGVVLYEMVTAKRPFAAQTPLAAAIQRLTEPPIPPREVVPALDPCWENVILRCLERRPEDRFQSASEIARALAAGEVFLRPPHPEDLSTIDVPPPARPRQRRARVAMVAIAGAAAIIGITGLLFWKSWLPAGTPTIARSSTAPVTMRPGIAVLGLRNNTGRTDDAWLSTAITEMLATELGSGGKLRVAPTREVTLLRQDLGLADPENLGTDKLRQVRDTLGVNSVVTGSFTKVGDSLLRIDLRLRDATSGVALTSSGASGTEAQLFDLVSRAAGAIRQKLGLTDLSPSQAIAVQASLPTDPEAVRLYAEGLTKLRRLDAVGSRTLLTRAAARSDHPLVHSALSAAHSLLGNDSAAREEAARAVALSENLGRELKLEIEARLHEASAEWDKAVELERSLWESFPDNVGYGLNLANAQISAGKTRESLVTIQAMRRLPAPTSDDGRIDLAEARARQELGDFRAQADLAAKAAAKGRRTGLRLLVAKARMLEATAHLNLGDLRATTSAIDEARTLFDTAGDRGSVARALELTALVVDRQGDLDGERRLLEQALSIHREIGDDASVAGILLNIGTVLIAQGRPAEAEKFFDDSLATFRHVGAKFPAAQALNNIGAMMFNRGDLAGAERRYRESLTLFGGEKTGTAATLTNIGEVLECRGNLEEARRLHEEALAINRGIGDRSGIGYDLYRLGGVFAIRGELVAAKAHLQEALTAQTGIGDSLAAADSRVALAELSLAQTKAAEAEREARAAEEILRTEGAADRSAYGQAVIADALRAQGKQAEASRIANRAWEHAAKSDDRRVRFKVAISRARALAASGKAADIETALSLLNATIGDARRTSFVVSEFEARLAAAEIELTAGRPSARKRLASLERDARTRGFGWIAARAAARL